MRTTLNIDDELYRRVKATAALRGCTVTSLIEDSLREALMVRESGQARPIRVLPERGGVRAGVDLTDGRALRELLDGERALDALR